MSPFFTKRAVLALVSCVPLALALAASLLWLVVLLLGDSLNFGLC